MDDNNSLDRLTGDGETVRAVFEQAPVLLLAVDGPRLTFSAANAAYRQLYPKFALGVSVWDTSPEVIDQQIHEMFARVYQTGEPIDAREWRVQIDVDGTGVREFYFDMLVTPRLDTDGTVVGIQIVGQDATERVRSRQAIQQRARDLQDRYETVRDAGTAMQRALLSPDVPILPDADIAAAYLVATEDTAAGGDWFDVIARDDSDDVCLVVGDVVGHGVRAAAVMAQLRTAVRMQLHSGAGIAATLTAVDRFAATIPGADATTICVVRLDSSTGDIEYCTAGHPPPLVVTVEGSATYLPPTGARPLGVGDEFAVGTSHLAEGEVVLLYSDGLVERPGRQLPASTAEIADIAARVLHPTVGFPLDPAQAPVQRLCSQAVEMLIRATGYSDDITLLAAQRRTPPTPLHADMPADDHAERSVRRQLREWLQAAGGDFVNGQILEHAVTEFVANAVEHAYAATAPGRVVVDATLHSDGQARITVADYGTWKTPDHQEAGRGRGLSIAQTMIPGTIIDRNDTGTTVTIAYHLTRTAHIVTEPGAPHAVPAAPVTAFDISVADDGSVVIAGDVDTSAAPTLSGALTTRSRAGTAPVTVDLGAVTHLGSAAVSVLATATRRADQHGTECILIAPPGSTAHHVMSLVGLPVNAADASEFDDL